jgi:hypothetical protein
MHNSNYDHGYDSQLIILAEQIILVDTCEECFQLLYNDVGLGRGGAMAPSRTQH